jgi:hypothetical protein
VATQSHHPAPGSGVPGAPPSLRRELTAQDGVGAPAPATTTDTTTSVVAPRLALPERFTRQERGRRTSSIDQYLTALGMISAAVAIEIGTRRTRAQVLHHATSLKEN